jgi:flagellar biosynthesis protein FliQ
MLRRIKEICADSASVEFESSFGIPESVERLKAATRRSVFSALARQEAVGTVNESRVSLQRVIPMIGNSFKPFFRGRFVERNGQVVLSGRFAMHWLARAFMAVWFIGVICGSIAATFQAATNGRVNAEILLFGPGMIAFGIALVWSGKWFARNDVEWLSNVIRRALTVPAAGKQELGCALDPKAQASEDRSIAMTVVAAVLGGLGLMTLAFALFDIQSAHTGATGAVIARHFSDFNSRTFSASYGTFLLILAYGVYRRRLLAWRVGLALIAVGWVYAISELFFRGNMPEGDLFKLVFGIGASLVSFMWGRWWYAQRVHFSD